MAALRTRRGARAILLAAAGVAVTLAVAAPADAATTIKVRADPIFGGQGMSVTGTTLPDSFQFDGSNGLITVTSNSGPVTAGVGCSQVGTFKAQCSGVVLIQAFGGSGADTIVDNTTARMEVNGGSDDDVLVGGPGRDTLNGGLGTDSVDGRGARDTCSAEFTFNCEEITS